MATDHKKQPLETKSQNSLASDKSSNSKKGKGKFGSNKVPKCMFCKGEHRHLDCTKYATGQSRRSILNIDKTTGKCADGRCSICLYFHGNSNCVARGLCTSGRCSNRQPHARFLCDASRPATSQYQLVAPVSTSVQSSDPQDPVTATYSISSNGKKSRSTALETCVLTALNRQSKHLQIYERQVALMLDSGAQRSVITNDMVEAMQFPIIGTERIALQGFNEKSPRSLEYKVVQVTLGKTGKYPIIFDALVVKNINQFYQAGAASFAKKVARVATLADPRFLCTKSDECNVDCLVANDHPLENPFKKVIT